MSMLKSCLLSFTFASLSTFVFSSSAFAQTKLSCTEVAATEAKCAEYDTVSKACDSEVDTQIKANIQKAKTAADACKKKNGMGYMLKCKKELKDSATAQNNPRPMAAKPITKDLLSKPDSQCKKAEDLGKATAVCKSPKPVLDAMKRNCIK